MIYNVVKRLCDEQGISIAECEKRAGLGNGVISGWKKGNPRLDKIRAVAGVLNTTVDALLEDNEEE